MTAVTRFCCGEPRTHVRSVFNTETSTASHSRSVLAGIYQETNIKPDDLIWRIDFTPPGFVAKKLKAIDKVKKKKNDWEYSPPQVIADRFTLYMRKDM